MLKLLIFRFDSEVKHYSLEATFLTTHLISEFKQSVMQSSIKQIIKIWSSMVNVLETIQTDF